MRISCNFLRHINSRRIHYYASWHVSSLTITQRIHCRCNALGFFCCLQIFRPYVTDLALPHPYERLILHTVSFLFTVNLSKAICKNVYSWQSQCLFCTYQPIISSICIFWFSLVLFSLACSFCWNWNSGPPYFLFLFFMLLL